MLKNKEEVKEFIMGKSKEVLNKDLRGVYFSGLAQIVKGTPADTGRARANWFLTTGSPSNSRSTSKSEARSNREILKTPVEVLGKKVYFTNNLPYIGVLEYGGYPNPVKKGTYNKRKNQFEIRSINGFSKQAPNGWVRRTLIKMANKIRNL